MDNGVDECSGDYSMQEHPSATTYELAPGVGYISSINIPNAVSVDDTIYEITKITGGCVQTDYLAGGACCAVPIPAANRDNVCSRCDNGILKTNAVCTQQCAKNNKLEIVNPDVSMVVGGRIVATTALQQFLPYISTYGVRDFDENDYALVEAQLVVLVVSGSVFDTTPVAIRQVYSPPATDVENVKFYKALMSDEYRVVRTSVETQTMRAVELFGNTWKNGHCVAYGGHSYTDVSSFDHCLARCMGQWWCVGFSYDEFYSDYSVEWSSWETLDGGLAKAHRDYYNISGDAAFKSRIQKIVPRFSKGVCKLSNTRCEYDSEYTIGGVEKSSDEEVHIVEEYEDNGRVMSIHRNLPFWKSRGAKRYMFECAAGTDLEISRACGNQDYELGGQCCQKTQMCSDFGYSCSSGTMVNKAVSGHVTNSVFQNKCCMSLVYEYSTSQCVNARCLDCDAPVSIVTDSATCENQFWVAEALGSMCDSPSACLFDRTSNSLPDSWRMSGACIFTFGGVDYTLCTAYRYV